MRVLVITDIHKHYNAAMAAHETIKPDLVLDCGDHEELKNIFEFTPHYYVHGNHEPLRVSLDKEGFPLPHRIASSQVYSFEKDGKVFTFTGVGGHYSSRGEEALSVRRTDIDNLRKISPGTLDVLLLHESPLNVESKNGNFFGLNNMVLDEIDRIRPSIVFSGHVGTYSERESPAEIPMISLDDMGRGYAVLDIFEDKDLYYERKIAVFPENLQFPII